MSEHNARQTYVNAIQRNYNYTKARNFRSDSIPKLKVRKELMEKDYNNFLTVHGNMLQKITKDKFNECDQVRVLTEGMYIDALTSFNEQIERLEDIEKRALQRIEQEKTSMSDRARANSVEANKKPHSTTNMGENAVNPPIVTKAARKQFQERKAEESKINEDDAESELVIDEGGSLDSYVSESECESAKRQKVRSMVIKPSCKADSEELKQRIAKFKMDTQKFQAEAQALVERTNVRYEQHTMQNVRESSQYRQNVRENQTANREIGRRPTPYERPLVRLNANHTRRYSNPIICNNCTREHKMKDCQNFLKRSINERRKRVDELGLCRNCFIPKYLLREVHRCPHGNCKNCGEFHNSLLCYHSRL